MSSSYFFVLPRDRTDLGGQVQRTGNKVMVKVTAGRALLESWPVRLAFNHVALSKEMCILTLLLLINSIEVPPKDNHMSCILDKSTKFPH